MCASPACPISHPRSCAGSCSRTRPDQAAQEGARRPSEEGVIRCFIRARRAMDCRVVGQLQLDVLVSRLEAEYKVEAGLEAAPFDTARWLKAPKRP